MKKIINTALMATVATILFSCQKQNDLIEPTTGTTADQNNFSDSERPWPGPVPFILSQWFSGDLNPDKDGGLTGSYVLNKPLPATNDTDVKLAYVRRNVGGIDHSTGGVTYYQLAVEFDTPHGHPVLMSFDLGTSLFEIFIKPIGIIGISLDPSEFKDFAYRYIVISKEDYNALNVEWSDYKAVARVLNFTP